MIPVLVIAPGMVITLFSGHISPLHLQISESHSSLDGEQEGEASSLLLLMTGRLRVTQDERDGVDLIDSDASVTRLWILRTLDVLERLGVSHFPPTPTGKYVADRVEVTVNTASHDLFQANGDPRIDSLQGEVAAQYSREKGSAAPGI